MSEPRRFEWLAFFRLLRLPNVFTAWADVLMGFLVAAGAFPASSSGIAALLVLLGATTGLYLGGMVLNDWFDFPEDLKARSFRPLPSKKFSLKFAARLGFGLVIGGLVLTAIAGQMAKSVSMLPAALGLGLSAAVLGYNGLLKATPVGPMAMGLCRTINILLGMSVGAGFTTSASSPLFAKAHLLIAAGIGIYIAGVTWFARREEAQSSRVGLILGLLVMLLGITAIAFAPEFSALPRGRIEPLQFRWLILLIGGVISARCIRAIAEPGPIKVQTAIKVAILSLIWLDAALALRVASFPEALLIASLIVPALLIGRAVYST